MSRTVSFFLFFFSSSGAPRLFPSFPTRRSSDLGGPCAPDWVTVGGADCGGGDSGGPVFAGEIAFGIMKGGTWDRAGKCRFYYYMSLDYLPKGWSLVMRGAAPTTPPRNGEEGRVQASAVGPHLLQFRDF